MRQGRQKKMTTNSHRLAIVGLIAVLHLPLIFVALDAYAMLSPHQGLTDLPATSLGLLLLALVFPYALLSLFGIRWNPPRGRLNERDV